MITLSGLGRAFGEQTLFEGVTMQLNSGARYGVVGANGSGKSTLLKILAGDDTPSAGSISMPRTTSLGVLRQDRFADDQAKIVELAMQGDSETFEALEELEAETPPSPNRQAELTELLTRRDGYTLRSRASRVLDGLGIPAQLHEQPLSTLSGGFQIRVRLAQVLLQAPDLLLLDEPTNHLDIVSIHWLEEFLGGYRGCLVVVSHDKAFLNRVATQILDVDYETITPYAGNYDDYVRQRDVVIEQKQKELARAEKLIAEKQAFVERFRAKATKARQAQSRVKQIEKIEVAQLKPSSRRTPHFRLVQARPSGRDVLQVEGLCKSYGEKHVLTNVSFELHRGQHLGIVGVNGVGKSTLLKLLAGQLEPDQGEVRWGHQAHRGYFPQDHREVLGLPSQTVLQALWETCPTQPENFVRSQLGRALFSGNDVDKRISALSGGEAARLLFAQLSVAQPNVLLLDEPTNHLDFEAIEALAAELKRFEGSLVLVSHNRWFVSQLCTRIIEITTSGVRHFDGSYDRYLEHFGFDLLDRAQSAEQARAERRSSKERETNVDWEEQKKLKNRLKSLPRLVEQAESAVEALEQQLTSHRAQYAEPGFYDNKTPDQMAMLQQQEQSMEHELEQALARWEQLTEEQQELSGLLENP